MRRRRNHNEEVGVSLFPFLAVLLCTMGALIVLLLVVTDRARRSTDEPAAAAKNADEPASAEDNPDTWRRRTEQLAETRQQVATIVEDRRTRLGQLEHTTRELENKIVALKERLEEQRRLAASDAEEVARTEEELKLLESRAAEAARNLEDIRRENTNRPARFSIVPYEGPNTTPRRPVYIECRGRKVILQPEGIVLGEDDFLLAGDAGNPLATVLRATREYLVSSRSLRKEEEPYPLIIVRPDAVEAYYGVRQSLQGWTTDFGYELVNQDWKLNFGPADPNLAIAQNRALAEARLRQSALVAMLERRASRSPTYRPAPSGGIVRDGGDSEFGPQSTPHNGGEAGEPGARGGRGTGELAGGTGLGQGHGTNGNDGAPGDDSGRGPAGSVLDGQGGSRRDGRRFDGQHDGSAAAIAAGEAGTRDGNVPDTSINRSGALAGGALSGRGDGGLRGENGTGPQTYGDTRGRPDDGDVRMPRPGEYGARTPNAETAANRGGQSAPGGRADGDVAANRGPGQTVSDGGSTAGSSGNGLSVGAPDATARHESAELSAESLAHRRGRDWGLRYAAPTATPVTRPLRVTCYGDRAIIQSDDPRREPKQIVFKPQTRDSADEFVAAVWDEIKAWGIAGKGMYWRPILSFDVHAGGDRRYEDMRKLLDGSGFEVRRKPTTIANQRPVGAPAPRRPW